MRPVKVLCEKDLKIVILLQENIAADAVKMMVIENDDIKKLSDSLNAALAEINNAAN